MKKALLITGAVIFIGLLLVGGLVFFSLFRGGEANQTGVSIEKEMEEPPELTLQSFRQLRGTQYFIAEIVTTSNVSFYEYSSPRWYEFSDRNGGLIRNLVFLDSETALSHALLENNHSYIINMLSFPPQPPPPASSEEEPEIVPIRWFVYEVAHQDTNLDGELNREDERVIGLSDVDGTRYKELIADVSDIYNLTMLDSGELLIVYRQKQNRFAAKVDLQAQEITTQQQLPDLGIEVK
jgi:hypothetical protein